MIKYLCEQCGAQLHSDDLLEAKNPFDDTIDVLGCPQCKGIDCFLRACDEDGCWLPATNGAPTFSGYKNTCHYHVPKDRLW